jgi:hypothetical protein
MKWLVVMFLGVSAIVIANGCTSKCDTCGTQDAQTLVSSGQDCTTAGATAQGDMPVCSDIGGGTTTCTCTGGKWDCGKCPACGPISLGAQCGIGQVCSGPATAKQCDGTTATTTGDCHCDSTGWACDGVTTLTCGDAGTDASSDAAKD